MTASLDVPEQTNFEHSSLDGRWPPGCAISKWEFFEPRDVFYRSLVNLTSLRERGDWNIGGSLNVDPRVKGLVADWWYQMMKDNNFNA